jgi:hypothetical protein
MIQLFIGLAAIGPCPLLEEKERGGLAVDLMNRLAGQGEMAKHLLSIRAHRIHEQRMRLLRHQIVVLVMTPYEVAKGGCPESSTSGWLMGEGI